MGYQADMDAMQDPCRRPLSLQQFHGEGSKILDLQSCQVAYLSLFRVDLEYTYALEKRLLCKLRQQNSRSSLPRSSLPNYW